MRRQQQQQHYYHRDDIEEQLLHAQQLSLRMRGMLLPGSCERCMAQTMRRSGLCRSVVGLLGRREAAACSMLPGHHHPGSSGNCSAFEW